MQEIWALGRILTPEYLGDAATAKRLRNLVAPSRDGKVRRKDADGGWRAVWAFTSSGGPRGVYVLYAASDEPRRCRLTLNGAPVLFNALSETTQGGSAWRYQTLVELSPGLNRIGLESEDEPPRFEAIAIAEPPDAPHASVDEAFVAEQAERARTAPHRPLAFRPAQLAGLLDVARSAGNERARHAQFARVMEQVLFWARRDSETGSARIAWGGGPLNGQEYRQRILSRLMSLDLDVIVETGAYIGTSTAFFARQGVPVFSCELEEKSFARAAAYLAEHPNITLQLEDSRSFLRGLAADHAFGFRRPLFYLDAHSQEDLPLADEIRIISRHWDEFVIMVDDFEVPATGYGFDGYPNGVQLTLGYLQREGVPLDDLAILFPSVGPDGETGARRGTLVLMPTALYERELRLDRTLFRLPTPAAGAGS